MRDADFASLILRPGLASCAAITGIPVSDRALQLMLAIAIQESNLAHRYQVLSNNRPGPARGWWQFERGGGVVGVMRHAATKDRARACCDHLGVRWQDSAIWRALEGHDTLAVCFARLLLWSDPKPLPGYLDDGWDYYLRNWRPGKPHRSRWTDAWPRAKEALA